MGTGPEVTSGFDLALTELDDGFVVRAGSPAGERAARRAWRSAPPTTAQQAAGARRRSRTARERIGDPVPHGRPAGTAHRGRATARAGPRSPSAASPAPTARSSARPASAPSVTQVSDLDGVEAVAERTWDSCFTLGFAKVAGGNFRPRTQDRYRQWLTHKFGTWWDQFGMSGCVGCGRCITWCPVGIDVREELMAVAPPPRRGAGDRAGRRPRGRGMAAAPASASRPSRGRCRSSTACRRPTRGPSSSSGGARPTTSSRSASRPTTRRSSPVGPASSSWPPCRPSPPRPISVSRFHAGRPRADDPGRRRRDPRAVRARARRLARPPRSAGPRLAGRGRVRPRRRRSSPAASGSRRSGRWSTRSSPTATASASSA